MGFEPMTQEFSTLCSTTELSRHIFKNEKRFLDEVGFEPTINKIYFNFQNWCFKPLNHSSFIRVVGFEPTIFCAQGKHVTITLYPN